MESSVDRLSDAELHTLTIDDQIDRARRGAAQAELDLRRRKHEFALLETWIDRWKDRVLTGGDMMANIDALVTFWKEKTEEFTRVQIEAAQKVASHQDRTAKRLNRATRQAAIAAIFSAVATAATAAVDILRLIEGK